jgi:phenylalanyl-tRNA synthetase beta chain
MKIPLSWLREFVTIEAPLEELCHRLTVAGLEVEKVEQLAPKFSGVWTAKVVSVERHPNADRLSLCEVDAGEHGRVHVVCGAPNVKPGMMAALAQVGARLGGADHASSEEPNLEETPPLEAATIRGVRSEGMLCSERELGLSTEHAGILELEPKTPLGVDLANYLELSDVVLDIAITPNRGDCLSVLGLAREIAALFDLKLQFPKVRAAAAKDGQQLQIEIAAPDFCPRYAGLAMSRVKIGQAPRWMTRRLSLCGMRSVNNLVDITNYVMLELGQPLHAFDLRKIEGGRIVVRRAGSDRQFTTLDNSKRELMESDLIIADSVKPLAIAGVMGGLDSEVSESTTEILLESAYFDPITIARTARRLGLRSEASYRFERGIDRDGQPRAILRAAELIKKLAGGRESSALTDIEAQRPVPRQIELEAARIHSLVGIEIPTAEIKRRLVSLGAAVSGRKGAFSVVPPSYRPDLNEAEDLIEEVVRLRGLDEIPEVVPPRTKPTPRDSRRMSLTRQTRDVMMGCGLTEINTIAFVAPADNRRFPGLIAAAKPVAVINSLSADLGEMRKSLVGGLVAALQFNLNREARRFTLSKRRKSFTATTLRCHPSQSLWPRSAMAITR